MQGEIPPKLGVTSNLNRSESEQFEEQATSTSDHTLPTGTLIQERFKILSLLGEGGMSAVYKAEDIVLGRTVAIKIMQSFQRMNAQHLYRFQREARSTAKLDHPGIIKVFDFYYQREPYCIAMELVEGQTLADYIKQSIDTSTDYILDTFIAITEALAHAHNHDVIHRDIKPSNIMLLPGSLNPVKVMDFGIAKGLEEPTVNANLTRTGEMIGSPLYMSPEQITNKALDRRTDIYSLGCTLYESLTKAPPFVAASAMETMMKHMSERPLSLKEASLGKEFPPGLEEVVQKFMEKDANNRYQSCEEANKALQMIRSARSSPDDKENRKVAAISKARPLLLPSLLTFTLVLVSAVIYFIVFAKTAQVRWTPTGRTDNLPQVMDDTAHVLQGHQIDALVYPSSKALPTALSKDQSLTGQRLNDEGLNDDRLRKMTKEYDARGVGLYRFNGFTLSDHGLEPLRGKTIKQLILEEAVFAPHTVSLLKEIKVEDLKLNGSNFTDAMSDVLKSMTGLNTVELSGTEITNAGLYNIQNLRLGRLLLEETKIDNAGIAILSRGSLRDTLAYINLINTNISDGVFNSLRKFSNLRCIHISHTAGITAPVLMRATYPPHLEALYAEMTPALTDTQAREIKKRLPKGCELRLAEVH